MWLRLAWACVAAGLLAASVPPLSLGWLAWVALVPLVLAVRGASPTDPGLSPGRAAIVGGMFGALSSAAIHFYLGRVPAFTWLDALVLLAYLALYPAAWCAMLAWLRGGRLPSRIAGAAGWALLHVVRSHAGFLSLPWEALSHSQTHDLALLQSASLGGAPLVGFVVCLGNLALADAWRTRDVRRLTWPLAAVLAVHAWGLLRIGRATRETNLDVAIVQPGPDSSSRDEQMGRLRALTLRAAALHPAFVVWPESAVHGYAFDALLREDVAEIAQEAGVAVLFGSGDFGKYAQEAGLAAEDVQFKNQAFFVQPDGTAQGPYTKNRLVPFAETVPLSGLSGQFTWPRWLVSRMRHGVAGQEPGLFRLPDGRLVGMLICWENLFGDLSARLASEGASAIVQLTNDTDFVGEAAPSQHAMASVVRAVEVARPLVVASAGGPSFAVDAYGRTSVELRGRETLMNVAVNTQTGVTVYSRCGLLWLWLTSIVAAALSVRTPARSRPKAERSESHQKTE
jgi:apolipoprotein N-acyltransferase